MRFSNLLKLFSLVLILMTTTLALDKIYVADERKTVNIDFKDLEIDDFIKLVSRIQNKNVLLNQQIRGKVEFISSTPIYKENLLEILMSVLETKGYTLIDHGEFFEVVRSNEAAKYNLPVMKKEDTSIKQMVTVSLKPKEENVDVVTSKIMHLVSKSAKVVTIRENNTILITDYPKNIHTIRNVISLIDDALQKEVRFIEIKNAQVDRIYPNVTTLSRELFNQRLESEKVTTVLDKENSKIVLVGKKANLDKLEEIIKDFDKEPEEEDEVNEVVKILTLKHSEAKEVSKVLKDIINTKKYTDPNDKPSISHDENKNAIVVVGMPEKIREVLEIIEQLDTEKQQVYVQAQIIEISTGKSSQLGIKYGLEGGTLNSSGLFTFAANLGGSAIAIDSFSSYISGDTVKSGLALGAGINFLKQNEAADIVSEPSILCVDNKESTIYVGQTESILTSALAGDNASDLTRNTYTREDIGLTLKVKPRISRYGKVSLEVETKLEDVLNSTSQNGTPTTTKREVNTNAIVNNGESVIIGGLIKGQVSGSDVSVPILSDIPILGSLFKNEQSSNDRTNLVIVLTPYIIDKSTGLVGLREKLARLDHLQQRYNRMVAVELEKRAQGKISNDEKDLLELRRELE